MVNSYQIPAAKGLFSAVFIQYCIYAILYILEGIKMKEIKHAEKEFQESQQ